MIYVIPVPVYHVSIICYNYIEYARFVVKCNEYLMYFFYFQWTAIVRSVGVAESVSFVSLLN